MLFIDPTNGLHSVDLKRASESIEAAPTQRYISGPRPNLYWSVDNTTVERYEAGGFDDNGAAAVTILEYGAARQL